MGIPRIQTDNADFNQFQSLALSKILPLLQNPIVNGNILTGVSLVSANDNVINHKLNRALQGWIIIRQRAAAAIYDKQDASTTPTKTLTLSTSANVTVDLLVF